MDSIQDFLKSVSSEAALKKFTINLTENAKHGKAVNDAAGTVKPGDTIEPKVKDGNVSI